MASETVGKRFHKLRSALELSQEAFGAPLGVSYAAISRWEKDLAEPPDMAAVAAEYLYGVSAQWLLTGEGPMWASKPGASVDQVWRPVLPGLASCGPGGEIADPGPQAPRYPFTPAFIQDLLADCGAGTPEDLYLVRCEGDSMRPTVFPGDLALVNTAEELRVRPKRDALHLVRPDASSTDARVKRVRIEGQEMVLLSDAQHFAPVRVSLEEVPIQSLVLGRVCWLSRAVTNDFGGNTSW